MSLQLEFDVVGAGPPVIILHGLFGSGRNWRSISQALAEHHRVYSVDLRNHGRSPWVATMSYPEMAHDVRSLIKAERLQSPTIIGHSMGGKTAMALALCNPELVGQLTVVDIAPVAYADRFSGYLEAMRSIDTRSLTKRADAMQEMVTRIKDVDIAGFLMQNLVPRDEHFDWRLNLPVIGAEMHVLCGFPSELLVRRFKGPATLIRGGLSDYVQPADEATIKELFPAIRIVEIKGAGHWVHADRPAEFLAALAGTSASSA
jgi:esterase